MRGSPVEFHYPLVADLLKPEEFELRVEERMRESGGLLDERTAAMIVARELGRGHVKISDVPASASICCLFGKVLSVEEPRRIVRADGTESVVGAFEVGDETGRLRCLLWGERAVAVKELEPGEVLEIIGRPSRSNPREFHPLAMMRTKCEIVSTCAEGAGPADDLHDLEMRLISLNAPRNFQRRDGSTACMQEGLAGDGGGTFRLVCWAPELLSGLSPPCTISLQRVRIRSGPYGRECHIDESSTVGKGGGEPSVPETPLAGVSDDEVCSVTGEITVLQEPRSFVTKDGASSWIRRMTLADRTGTMEVALWGDLARLPLAKGERISAFHLLPKRGRDGLLQLNSIRGTVIVVHKGIRRRVEGEGTVVPGVAGDRLDAGGECYLLVESLPAGAFVRVIGDAEGSRLYPVEWEVIFPEKEMLERRLDLLIGGTGQG
ncbi:MAG: hypothetical protein QHG99_00310 [Methanomicrobiales archaeon]|nr:hypothetical protein [Methanomicrobiales archaeon]